MRILGLFLIFMFIILFFNVFNVNSLSYSIKPDSFLIYNETSYIYYPKYFVQKIIIIQEIEKVFDNGSMLVNSTIIALSENTTLPSTLCIQNESSYGAFFYVNPSLLGKNISYGKGFLIFNETKNGLFQYYVTSYIEGVENDFILYFNSSGVVVKSIDYQTNGNIISKSVDILWKDNIFSNTTLPIFHVGHKKPISIKPGAGLNENLGYKLIKIFAITALLLVLVILLTRKT
ncbi:hypothetical protein [Acidianus brierleyi]|uniref:Uncharacterized protein n=1 Tax=Acidianus brierleyi TaxID=41673 RepID=A0A2U9IE14_9CREN|nr:hypothetical protein [Acidianus brierleyi]AWR94239.1 hypothetical protein DFR85_06175 [Acidianus brierleyi]